MRGKQAMSPSRREFMKKSCCSLASLGVLGTLGRISTVSALAAPVCSDYRALVCIFLFGGNDANNLTIPIDPTGYQNYAAARGNPTLGGRALAQNSLLTLNGGNYGV